MGAIFHIMPKQAFANEVVLNALRDLNLSTELEPFKYKGRPMPGWTGTPELLRLLYSSKASFPKLDFTVFIEVGGKVRLFRLMEPAVRLRARAKRHLQAENKEKAKMI